MGPRRRQHCRLLLQPRPDPSLLTRSCRTCPLSSILLSASWSPSRCVSSAPSTSSGPVMSRMRSRTNKIPFNKRFEFLGGILRRGTHNQGPSTWPVPAWHGQDGPGRK
ncbi:hypothetical protein AMAG_19148 [Allomyces macrogynus ATCC 38327]|uniref:Uncharacterized protein n=1 Tax=Allomyces macrogynus (strain ATCC 38327) TaxID=578462 RepID=A0A0L0SP94_ALLM3|nr:hypothetical protein AMAG_19148 [Allomyces macrogynus ATCC 38327]|eukprot:KNE64341.1 hypothetical protein AMAG_19148 [Allomyces macrogynus ATCC 38327]